MDDVRRAAERILPYARKTPVLTCGSLDGMAGARLFFKCENFQRVGAFKFRGALNAVMSMSEEEARAGVATHSSGNHAAALALAARLRGVAAYVVMPSTAPAVKRAAVEGYGALVTGCDPTLESRESTLESVVAATGAARVHPYDDDRVIAGQGTAALEMVEEVGVLDVVMAPVGGGGLMSGTCIAVSALAPGTRLIAAEPAGADDAARSLAVGRIVPQTDPRTIADGLRAQLSARTFAILRDHLERVVTVSEEAILDAMIAIWQRMKIVVEPSSAVPLAAILGGGIDVRGLRVGMVLTGGNVDVAGMAALFAGARGGGRGGSPG